jgi:hypothetical protein
VSPPLPSALQSAPQSVPQSVPPPDVPTRSQGDDREAPAEESDGSDTGVTTPDDASDAVTDTAGVAADDTADDPHGDAATSGDWYVDTQAARTAAVSSIPAPVRGDAATLERQND